MQSIYKTISILSLIFSLIACNSKTNNDKTILAAGLLFLQNQKSNSGIGGPTATRVYAQLGSFTTNTTNKGGVSANSFYAPNGIALDSSGNLYVADSSNNRVLYYPSNSTTATRVYGQGGSFTT
ncbi:MAG TPA: hypothetical protein PLP33_26230, partial [Leptospiraceae bacterium]|nr:hypothetical protein [Leptospiraceae bacterium]